MNVCMYVCMYIAWKSKDNLVYMKKNIDGLKQACKLIKSLYAIPRYIEE